MKKLVSILICLLLLVSFASCGTEPAVSREDAMQTYAAFQADLVTQEIVAENARLVVSGDGNRALVTDIKNNAPDGKTISEVSIAFAVWDVEGNPVAIRTEENPDNKSNIMKATVDVITVAGGESWTGNMGLFLSDECKHIAYVSAIALLGKIEDDLWENPLYDVWLKTYCDLSLETWQLESMVNYLDGDTAEEAATAETMPFDMFYESLRCQDIVAVQADANLQSDGRNALMTNITNASQAQATELVIAFVMWDVQGEPLMITSASGQSEASYVKEVDMGALTIAGKTTWDADMGLVIANERQSISHVEAIVVSCKFGDSQWNNPLYDTWCTYFSGCQLDDAMMSDLAKSVDMAE